MYLPDKLPQAKVLITVKTYPLPSSKYEELVCTAGFTEDGKWIRIYPIPFRSRPYEEQYKKYNWIQLNLTRKESDFRPESYSPVLGIDEPIVPVGSIDTKKGWMDRKAIALKEVFDDMSILIKKAKGSERKSLATLKPLEITDFVVEETDREWKPQWQKNFKQLNLFDSQSSKGASREIVRKVPYKFSYKFLTKGDKTPRKIMIEDWEIGALYWNCLAQTEGDEQAATELVRKKYFDEFVTRKDIYFFMGTTLQYQAKNAPNPFLIIGVFYPPKEAEDKQLPLF